ncbi:Predicted dithiol-disulfide isomerase, DsbA family [Monaibacterium marinum]|uniref:Predicted dithiol-disulfide isomerase, DsbA family n=1 Tax=Pontivivens marinum TaxID=1690039 RepID=A0A2C9CQ72_9RHOB|nr:DsbA family oxidoreductase [Monaibacterium marinum]SOH93691.1 Predicted dithiol-disulfide isomerase, DsbA family [Monaibacterium marinum]
MTRLEIISDPICPWCYIGKAKLDKALETAPNPFEITWRPFQLNPDMPATGMDRRAYLEGKFGKDRATPVYAQIEAAAVEAGLDVDFSQIKRTPNTVDAHRMIRWAKTSDHQTALVTELFARYFKLGQDISDHAILLNAAEVVGMDTEVMSRLLAGDVDRDVVIREDTEAREMGVSGVPTFLIGGRYAVQGAQDAATWANIIAEISEASAAMPQQ